MERLLSAVSAASGSISAASGRLGPILPRHLPLHHRQLQPGRIEDAPVVGEPERFAGVGRRRLVSATARTEGELLTVPVHAALRREDGPAHGGEAAHEERRGRLDDVVLGLEPGDMQRLLALALVDGAKAHEGGHLVHVTAHRLGHLLGRDPVRVERVMTQPGLGLQPPEEAIEQA
jgi:hypothetical protein